MFDSGWLSVIGLGAEFIGLFFLSWDLLGSKTTEHKTAGFDEQLRQLDASSRALIINTHKGFRTLTEFLKGYLSLLELETGEAGKPKNAESENLDEETKRLLAFIHDQGPHGIRRFSVEKFVEVSNSLVPVSEVDRALELNETAKTELAKRFAESVEEGARLRRRAMLGIAFAAAGALLQFTDLFW
jgi:hypothetical protein